MQTNEPIRNPNQQTSSSQPVNNQPASETPVAQPSTSNKKITNWLLIGLVVLLLGTTGVFAYKYFLLKQELDEVPPTPTRKVTIISLSPTPSPKPTVDPTANWKTYTSSMLGLSFRYPIDWSITRESDDKVRIENLPHIIFSMSKNIQEEESYIEVAKNYVENKKDPELISVDGFPAAYLKIRPGDPVGPIPLPFNFLTIQKNGFVYTVYYYFGNSDATLEKENEKVFDQILSTFKFTD